MSEGARRPILTAFDIACRWLARAPRSRAEVDARLRQLGFSDRAVEQALHRLCQLHFLDDEQLARTRAEALTARGYGNPWIERDLTERGISEELVASTLAALPAETERAHQWLERRLAGRARRVAWDTLLRRGFTVEAVESLLGPLDDEEGGPPD